MSTYQERRKAFYETVEEFRTTPLAVLQDSLCNPVEMLHKPGTQTLVDAMSDDEYAKFCETAEYARELSDLVWCMQTIVHPETLLGRLIIEDSPERSLFTKFRACRHMMQKEKEPERRNMYDFH